MLSERLGSLRPLVVVTREDNRVVSSATATSVARPKRRCLLCLPVSSAATTAENFGPGYWADGGTPALTLGIKASLKVGLFWGPRDRVTQLIPECPRRSVINSDHPREL